MKQFDTPALVPADPEANATDLLVARVAATPDAPLFSLPDGDGWRDVTAAEFLRQVVALSKGLVAAGIQPGDKIGLMCKTRYEWTLIDFATWFAGAVLVPIYETSSPTQVQWNMSDSGAIAVILETAEMFARFDEVHPELPHIAHVWQIAPRRPGQARRRRRRRAGRRRSSGAATSRTGDDIGTLIYTSGSTGRPKGCVLTHSNFVELSRNSAEA